MGFWQDRKVLVTGAGGFVGSHLAERLVSEGAQVKALVRYNALGRWGWLEESTVCSQMEIVLGDVTDGECMRHVVEQNQTVFHLAALIGIPYSYHAPESYVRTNILGTLNVLRAVRDAGAARMVHTSTSEVYGTARTVPITEEHPLQGQSPYSASKIGADKMAEAFRLSYGLPVVTVRPFNVYGPRQSLRAVIPTIIAQCLRGTVVKLGNVSPTRDLNYVANTVDGFLSAGQKEDIEGKTLNLGSGREISVGALARLIADLINQDIRIVSDEQRLRPEGSEVDRLMADASLADEILQWRPRFSLEEGLKLTIEWFEANLGRYRPEKYTI